MDQFQPIWEFVSGPIWVKWMRVEVLTIGLAHSLKMFPISLHSTNPLVTMFRGHMSRPSKLAFAVEDAWRD